MQHHAELGSEEDLEPLLGDGKEELKERTANPDAPTDWTSVALLVVMCLVLGISAMKHHEIVGMSGMFFVWCEHLGPYAAVLVASSVFAANICGVPAFALYIGAGVLFARMYGLMIGTVVGSIAVFTGVWTGSIGCFVIGRSLLRSRVERGLRGFKWMEVVNAIVDQDGWKFVFLARMSPALPTEAFNYACSVTDISLSSFALGCIGSYPNVLFWVWSAASATQVATTNGSDAHANRKHLLTMLALNACLAAVMLAMAANANKRYQQLQKDKCRGQGPLIGVPSV